MILSPKLEICICQISSRVKHSASGPQRLFSLGVRTKTAAHFAEKISAPQLVKLSGYGRSRFFSLFLADTGMTPNDCLVRVRIEKASHHAGSGMPHAHTPDKIMRNQPGGLPPRRLKIRKCLPL